MKRAAQVLPAGFIRRLSKLVPPDIAESSISSFLHPRIVTFRLNALRAQQVLDAADLSRALGVPVTSFPPFAPNCFAVDPAFRNDVTTSPLHKAGNLYVATASSFLPPLALHPPINANVIDAASAPGGKTIHLADIISCASARIRSSKPDPAAPMSRTPQPAVDAAETSQTGAPNVPPTSRPRQVSLHATTTKSLPPATKRILAIERDPRRHATLASRVAACGAAAVVSTHCADSITVLRSMAVPPHPVPVAHGSDAAAHGVSAVTQEGFAVDHGPFSAPQDRFAVTHILADAPCSGDALLTADNDYDVRQWADGGYAALVAIQTSMLAAAVEAVAPGGMVVYSTCTLNPQECEGVVSAVVRGGGASGGGGGGAGGRGGGGGGGTARGEVRGPKLKAVCEVVPFDQTDVGVAISAARAAVAAGGAAVRGGRSGGVAVDVLLPTLLPGVTSWEGVRYDPSVAGTVRVAPSRAYAPFYVAVIRRVL